ncbi:MAG: acyl-CoA dehydrogenase family protein [Acidobacteriota bacterium]
MPRTIAGQEAGRADLADWRHALGANRFDTDLFAQRLLQRHLGDDYAEMEPRLRAVADAAGERLAALIEESSRDEHLPAVRRHGADGDPVEDVVFHPAYHEAGRVFWASGVLAELAETGHEVRCGALAYLLDQHGEGGHACPVACTAGAIKLLQRVGSDAQRERYLPALLESDYESRLHAAQFVTEVQGGSDVGLNACVAVPEPGQPGWYRISGEKWFCSVADAGLFVVSARPDGAQAGTRGLGLFLVPRRIDGAPNGFQLRRLKWKLGTRSMATGEIEFDGALGEALGPLGDGFRNLVGIVLDTSRVHNALAACGVMRGAFVEAQLFAARRRAFERPIIEYPAVQELLARMKVRTMTALATTFRILAMSDRIDTGRGDEGLVAARRIAVMINKSWTALACTAAARDGIEVLGGNGTIEDFSPLPRLWRDAIVVESWEGTHNTLAAQVVRDFGSRRLHAPWLEQIDAELTSLAHPQLAAARERGRVMLADVSTRVSALLAADPEAASATMRHVLDRGCRLTDWVSLAAQRQWELEQGVESETADAMELYELAFLDGLGPDDAPRLIDLHRRLASGL